MPAPRAKNRRAGPRIHQITFVSVSTATQDGSGAAIDVAADVCTQWASINPLHGGESWIPPQLVGSVTHEIITDYFAGLTTKHRIRFGARTFDIKNIRNLEERNIQYAILANEPV